MSDYWISCPWWTFKDLQGKSVEFRLSTPEAIILSTGHFRLRENGVTHQLEICIYVITAPYPGAPSATSHQYYLPEEAASKIQRHPDPSKAEFRCLA